MKLPTPLINDTNFHTFMSMQYGKAGLPFFSALHSERVMKLQKMKAKVYLLECEEINQQLNALRQYVNRLKF